MLLNFGIIWLKNKTREYHMLHADFLWFVQILKDLAKPSVEG